MQNYKLFSIDLGDEYQKCEGCGEETNYLVGFAQKKEYLDMEGGYTCPKCLTEHLIENNYRICHEDWKYEMVNDKFRSAQ